MSIRPDSGPHTARRNGNLSPNPYRPTGDLEA
jgi:hypothetical protein